MADPKYPINYSLESKEYLIKFMTDAGYGKCTNYDDLDYKFFEDTDHAENVFILVDEITRLQKAKLEQQHKLKCLGWALRIASEYDNVPDISSLDNILELFGNENKEWINEAILSYSGYSHSDLTRTLTHTLISVL